MNRYVYLPLAFMFGLLATVSATFILYPTFPFLASEFGATMLVILFAMFLMYSVHCVAMFRLLEWESYEEYTTVRTHNPRRYRRKASSNEPVDPPTREELNELKEGLGIKEGSLQFKRRGLGIYHVLYKEGKHVWIHIGSWSQLKERL